MAERIVKSVAGDTIYGYAEKMITVWEFQADNFENGDAMEVHGVFNDVMLTCGRGSTPASIVEDFFNEKNK